MPDTIALVGLGGMGGRHAAVLNRAQRMAGITKSAPAPMPVGQRATADAAGDGASQASFCRARARS